MKIELFLNESQNRLVVHDLVDDTYRNFTAGDKNLVEHTLCKISEDFPEAFNTLKNEYNDNRFLMAIRFLRCNSGMNDTRIDIDDDFNFNLEYVFCPLRGGLCNFENCICNPKLNSNLTERELQVARLLVQEFDFPTIGDKLFISPYTVENHKKKIFKKLGIHAMSQLTNYFYKNNLIK